VYTPLVSSGTEEPASFGSPMWRHSAPAFRPERSPDRRHALSWLMV